MTRERIRLALIDDRPLFCRGLELLLPQVSDDRVQVAATTADAAAAAGLVRRCEPDLVLVDLALPDPGGVRAIGAIRRTEPGVPVVAMGRDEQPQLAFQALRAGASGVLPTASQPEDLVLPLLALAAGYAVVPTPMLDHLVDQRSAAASTASRLNPAERRLWQLVAGGSSTTEISLRLHVSERTAKRQIAALLRQLRVSSRTEAAALAGRSGLLDRPA
jgi:two-component system nitrate/nitrite response regulator NarL